MHFRSALALALVAALTALPTASTSAQSLLDRTPNLSGNWTGAPGTLYFHFLHRFTTSGAPERKVTNVPTFLIGGGLPKRLFLGANYSTNSSLAPRFPNEWELFGRWLPLSQDVGHPLDVGAQVGYNNAAEGVDGELSVARRLGIARLIVAGRALSNPFDRGEAQFVAAGGAVIRLGTYLAISGDVATLTDPRPTEKMAWGVGLHMAIPLTPHTFSLHATNTLVSTLQGSSRGTDDVRYGFEFTVPLTLRRYFGKRAEPPAVAEAAAADSIAPADTVVADTARVVPQLIPQPARVDTVPIARADTVRPPVSVARPDTAAAARAGAPTPRPTPPRTTTRPAPRRDPGPLVRSTIRNIAYAQPRIEVTAGTTVEWINRDPLPHTVTSTTKAFDSGLIQPSKTYRRTFSRAGTYEFFCTPHPFMKGTVVVKPAAP